VPRTLVFCHAHPDDEALLTSGTMAKATAAGHRVVVVAATSGEAGLVEAELAADLGQRRRSELAASADALGVAEVIHLGYADSGLHGEHDGFAHADGAEVAQRLAGILNDVAADIVVGYDASGGYGHPDHIAVHRMVRDAVMLRPTQTFEVTLPREPLRRAVRLAGRAVPGFDPHSFDDAWTPAAQITHRVNVRAHLAQKRASLAAHASQETGASVRTLGVLRRLPPPLFGALLGTEYYVEVPATMASTTRSTRSSSS
jgi:LmbE family N-acetylglucosaminyl deacetylase